MNIETHLSQTERLEFAASTIIIPRDSIGADERIVTLSTPPNGFRMPSMSRVREHDARLSAYGSCVNVQDDESDEDEESEDELRDILYAKRSDSLREYSFRMPSQRSRRDVTDTLRSMGCTYGE